MAEIFAKFTQSENNGVAPINVNFTNTSTGPYKSCRWDFGDGSSTTIINPSHQYTKDGTWIITLTIFDEFSGKSETKSSVTIFADDNYSVSSSTQQALFTSKRFTTGQVAVRKTVVDGSIIETSFPVTATTAGFSTTNSYSIPMVVSASTGSSFAQVHYNASVYSSLAGYVGAGAEAWLGLFLKSGTTVANPSCGGHQLFMYRIASATGGLISLDRPTPSIKSGSTSITFPMAAIAIVTFSGLSVANTLGPNTPYKSVQCAPAIDSLSTLNLPSMYSPNVRASGTFNYFENNDGVGTTKLFISPTHSGWSTVEAWKPSSVRLTLPYVMWHDKSTSGISLIDSIDTMVDPITNLSYSNLKIENNEAIVGKVFHESKLLMIDDLELQAALNWLSNRNYTLPTPRVTSTSTVDPDGGLQTGCTYFVTYRVRDTAPYSASQFGTTNVQSLHCRNIQEITPSLSGYKFRIQAVPSVWQVTSRGSVSTGFTSSNVDILIASGETGSTLADITSWYYTGGVSSSQLAAGVDISFSTGGTMNVASFNTLSISGNSSLRFGDDQTLLGYFSATAVSTIYKMSTTLVAKNNEFNTTQNNTFDETINESVYITEAALYNENNELLMIGKLNNPIEKNDKKFVTIKMELDL